MASASGSLNLMAQVADARRDPRFKSLLRRRAARMYRQGRSLQEIADALGLSKGRAYILAMEGGAPMRPRGPKA